MTDTLDRAVAGNGHAQGRAVPPLPSFTFPDSGRTVQIHRLAPDTQTTIAQAVAKEKPQPEPPIEEVEGLDGKLTKEPNPSSPAHQEALQSYLRWYYGEIGTRLYELALRRIVCEVDAAAVQTLREDMAAVGTPLPDDLSDRDIYIRQICISSWVDRDALMAYVQRRSGPTEAAIQEQTESFRG